MRKCPAPGCANKREKSALTCFIHWQVLPLEDKLIAAAGIKARKALTVRRYVRLVLAAEILRREIMFDVALERRHFIDRFAVNA